MNLQDLKNNLSTFSFASMVSNSDGKTSSSGFCGVMLCIVGALCFAYGSYIKNADILMYSTGVITFGAGLLGYRKSKTDKSVSDEATTISKLPPTT